MKFKLKYEHLFTTLFYLCPIIGAVIFGFCIPSPSFFSVSIYGLIHGALGMAVGITMAHRI